MDYADTEEKLLFGEVETLKSCSVDAEKSGKRMRKLKERKRLGKAVANAAVVAT
jgi:hypothetical protein